MTVHDQKITGRQISAARALLGLSQAGLARMLGLHRKGVAYWELREKIDRGASDNLADILGALENQGIEFLDGEGVRLRKC
ncbi:MAG: transcriptional regulator [Parvularculaceae bacterium]